MKVVTVPFERGQLRQAWAVLQDAMPAGATICELPAPAVGVFAHRFKGARILSQYQLIPTSKYVYRIDVAYETTARSIDQQLDDLARNIFVAGA